MFMAHGMTCKECGRGVGTIISPTAHRDTLLLMEFACRIAPSPGSGWTASDLTRLCAYDEINNRMKLRVG